MNTGDFGFQNGTRPLLQRIRALHIACCRMNGTGLLNRIPMRCTLQVATWTPELHIRNPAPPHVCVHRLPVQVVDLSELR